MLIVNTTSIMLCKVIFIIAELNLDLWINTTMTELSPGKVAGYASFSFNFLIC